MIFSLYLIIKYPAVLIQIFEIAGSYYSLIQMITRHIKDKTVHCSEPTVLAQ